MAAAAGIAGRRSEDIHHPVVFFQEVFKEITEELAGPHP